MSYQISKAECERNIRNRVTTALFDHPNLIVRWMTDDDTSDVVGEVTTLVNGYVGDEATQQDVREILEGTSDETMVSLFEGPPSLGRPSFERAMEEGPR